MPPPTHIQCLIQKNYFCSKQPAEFFLFVSTEKAIGWSEELPTAHQEGAGEGAGIPHIMNGLGTIQSEDHLEDHPKVSTIQTKVPSKSEKR